MKIVLSFVLSAILSCALAQGGKPYAVWEDQNTNDYYFVRLDAATGSKTNIAVIPGVTGVVIANTSAFNSVQDRYHFVSLNGGGQYVLNTINAVTGAAMYNPVLSSNIAGLEFNPADTSLYALRINANSYDIVKVDPITGQDTMVITVGSFSGYVSSSFCLHEGNQRYSFIALMGTTYALRVYDLVSKNHLSTLAFPDNVVAMKYSCATDKVYGLWEDNGMYKLEEVDQLSATHTTVGTLAGVAPGYLTDSHSADKVGHYTFRGFDSTNNFALFKVDVSNANIVASAPCNYNAVGFEESGNCTVTFAGDNDKGSETVIFPNPSEGIFTVRSDNEVGGIEIFSADGVCVAHLNAAGKSVNVDVSNLAAGIYFVLRLLNNEPSGSPVKVVVSK